MNEIEELRDPDAVTQSLEIMHRIAKTCSGILSDCLMLSRFSVFDSHSIVFLVILPCMETLGSHSNPQFVSEIRLETLEILALQDKGGLSMPILSALIGTLGDPDQQVRIQSLNSLHSLLEDLHEYVMDDENLVENLCRGEHFLLPQLVDLL